MKKIIALIVMLIDAAIYGWALDFERQTTIEGWWGAPMLLICFITFAWGVQTIIDAFIDGSD